MALRPFFFFIFFDKVFLILKSMAKLSLRHKYFSDIHGAL